MEQNKTNGIEQRTTQEYIRICPLCHEATITGSSVKQLDSRLEMHQRSRKCKKDRKQIK
ncbi:MAG: hypothetical protein AABY22_20260 [Nanoarchaeota archaeon]